MDIPIIISETNSFRHNFCLFKMTSLFKLMKVQLLTAIVANILFSQRVVGYYPQWVQSSLPISSIDFEIDDGLI